MNSSDKLIKRPIKLHNIDCDIFLNKINEQDTQTSLGDDVNANALYVSDAIYNCAYASRSRNVPAWF